MILTDTKIREAFKEGAVVIEPFDDSQVQPASYDLTVGDKAISTSSGQVVDVEKKGYFTLRPGDFAVLLTRETLCFDASHTARIGLRSGYARKGIIASLGPQVDPGFRGRLKIGLTNLSPHAVSFPFQDDLVTLEIHQLPQPAKTPYEGPYQGDTELSPEDIRSVSEGENMSFAKVIETLQSLSSNVAVLTESISAIKWMVGISVVISTVAITAALGVLTAFQFG